MTFIDLTSLTINEVSINVIDIYLYQRHKQNPLNNSVIDISLDSSIIHDIESKFKNPKITSFKSYYMNDKIYTYDMQNDNQIVTSKNKVESTRKMRQRKDTDLFMVSSKIEKFPIYMFPCTSDIDYISEYTIKEFKINNRISINIRSEDGQDSAYIEYKHSDNVEMNKINETIGRLLSRI